MGFWVVSIFVERIGRDTMCSMCTRDWTKVDLST